MSQTSKKLAALAGTAVSTTLLASEASAGIVYETTPISVAPDSTNNLEWDVDGGGTDLTFSFYPAFTARDFYGNPEALIARNGQLANLATGFLVGGTLTGGYSLDTQILSIVAGNGAPGFTLDTDGFIGFSFENTDGNTRYGWASIKFTAGTTIAGITINEWAYEDTGLSIAVGDTGAGPAAVPEPSTLALMAMGIGGIYQLKRRRKKTEPTADDAVSG